MKKRKQKRATGAGHPVTTNSAREQRIMFRVSSDENARLAEYTAASGLTRSEHVRRYGINAAEK